MPKQIRPNWKKEIIKIMSAGSGPFTKKMLRLELEKKYPDMSWMELNLEISFVFNEGTHAEKPTFIHLKKGGWILAKKNPDA